MAVVPVLDNFSVQATDGVPGRVAAAPVQNASGQQLSQLGAATQGAGKDFAEIQAQQLQLANQLRVNDAINKAKEQISRLTFDPADGFTHVKGIDALERPNGASLATEWGDKLKTQMDTISSQLGNDAQRRAFSFASNNLMAGFNGDIQQHVGQEFQHYGLSVTDGTISNAQDDLARNYTDPDQVTRSTSSIAAAVFQKGRILGSSASEIEAETRKATSGAHRVAMEAALQNNDLGFVQSYMNAHKSEINAEDALAVQGKVTKQMDATYASQAAARQFYGPNGPGSYNSPSAQIAPTNFDRLHNLVGYAESRNLETNAQGGVLTSPKGAKGSMQVLDGTSADPGFGVTPAKDNSPEERARVGRDYLDALISHNGGDVIKALSAYNWGQGNVDKAIKTYGNAWFQHAPTETQKYATGIYSQYKQGGGTPSGPQQEKVLGTMLAGLATDPYLQSHPEAMEQAQQHVHALYEAQRADVAQSEESQTGAIERQILGNGGHLTPALAAQTPDKALGHALTFANQVQELQRNPVKQSDLALYGRLRTAITNGDVTDPNQLLPASFRLTDSDYKDLVNLTVSTQSRDQKTMANNTLAQQTIARLRPDLIAAGVNPSPKADDEDGASVLSTFNAQLYRQLDMAASAKGKPLTNDEARQIGLGLLAETHISAGHLPWSGYKRGFELGDTGVINAHAIPAGTRNFIVSTLKQHNIPPTDENIQRFYATRNWTGQ